MSFRQEQHYSLSMIYTQLLTETPQTPHTYSSVVSCIVLHCLSWLCFPRLTLEATARIQVSVTPWMRIKSCAQQCADGDYRNFLFSLQQPVSPFYLHSQPLLVKTFKMHKLHPAPKGSHCCGHCFFKIFSFLPVSRVLLKISRNCLIYILITQLESQL